MRRLLLVAAVCCLCAGAPLRSEDKKGDDKKMTCLDLQPRANSRLDEDVFGNRPADTTLKELKTGEQTFEGVRFNIGEKYIQLASTNVPARPEKVDGIKVNRKFAKLHILHATVWSADDDAIVGEYTVTWDDDTSVTIPIRYGKDILDWWYADDDSPPSEAKVAWKGENEGATASGKKIRLYLSTWENPKPDKKVVKIDCSSTKQTPAAPFCVAMTVAEK
jgi:hypothetical protein